MTLEEKLKEQMFMKALYLHLPEEVTERVIKETAIYIQQEIDEACKKQREICAKEYLRDKGYSDTTQSVISTIILNAPSPKEEV